eukprot:jgi/Botrbrau1/2373/Bobra.0395s0007.1
MSMGIHVHGSTGDPHGSKQMWYQDPHVVLESTCGTGIHIGRWDLHLVRAGSILQDPHATLRSACCPRDPRVAHVPTCGTRDPHVTPRIFMWHQGRTCATRDLHAAWDPHAAQGSTCSTGIHM